MKQPSCIMRILEFNIFPQLQWRAVGDLRRHKFSVLYLHAAIVICSSGPPKHWASVLLFACDCMDGINTSVMRSLVQPAQSPHHLHWIRILPELCLLLWLIQLRRECTVHLEICSGPSSARGGSRNWNPGWWQETYLPHSFMSLCCSKEFRLEVIVVWY